MQSSASPASAADALICVALRGETPSWPGAESAISVKAVIERADYHGVAGLLTRQLAGSGWPATVLQALRSQATVEAMWELSHQHVLFNALEALSAIQVQALLLKGTALAYSLYPDPALRSRGDTDLIVPAESRFAVHQALLACDFERDMAVSGELVTYQSNYARRAHGSEHTLDVHWKINNSEVLSRLFTHAELLAGSHPLPTLSPHARGPDAVHALLIACMHRATHKQNPYYVNGVAHYTGDRLIWLYDIHLLAAQLSPDEWNTFTDLAQAKGLRQVCLEGMESAQRSFHTAYPASVLDRLARDGRAEPAAAYLAGSQFLQQWMDFKALQGWHDRWRFALELVFPPASYMRWKYAGSSQAWLPWLYLRRAVGGIGKRLSGNRTNA